MGRSLFSLTRTLRESLGRFTCSARVKKMKACLVEGQQRDSLDTNLGGQAPSMVLMLHLRYNKLYYLFIKHLSSQSHPHPSPLS